MKNSTKVVLGTFAAIAIGSLLRKIYKKSKKEVELEIEKEVETLVDAGLDPKKLESNKKDLPGDNFVENVLYTLLYKMNEEVWDDDTLKTNDFENGHDQSLWGSLRVIQRDDETVSVLIHIPPYFGNRGNCEFKTLSQYKEDILEVVRDFLSDNNIKGMTWKYRGYYERVTEERADNGDLRCITEEIPECDCKRFSDHSYSDGLARLVSYFYDNNAENLKKEEDLLGVCMFVEIQLPLATSERDMYGVDIIKMISLLKKLTFGLNIMDRGLDCTEDCFPSIIFFPEKNFDIYFHTEENKNGVLNQYWACRLTVEE